MRIQFGAYEPDKPAFGGGGLREASNVYRSAVGYRPVGQLTTVSDALPSAPVGAASFVGTGTAIIAGTASALYRLNGTAWSSLATGYTASSWSFAQFGSFAIAANGTDPIQKIGLTTFPVSALGGSPPTAKLLTVVKDFLVAGYVGGVSNKLQWSAINNAEGWTVGLNQCDYQILPSGGEVTGLLGGEVGIILQRNRVSRMTYVGSNLVFQFDEISSRLGCVHSNSVIHIGQMGFWLSDSGFVMWDGATISPIGQEIIDRTFAESYTSADWASMSPAVDVKNSLVAWAMSDRIFLYNWVLRSWSVIEKGTALIFSGLSAAEPLFYAFDSTHALGTFTGGPMEATFDLGVLELAPGREARIAGIRPLGDAVDGVSLSLTPRLRAGDAVSESIYDSLEDNGEMAVRESGRYIGIKQTILSNTNWTYAEGLDVAVVPGARR